MTWEKIPRGEKDGSTVCRVNLAVESHSVSLERKCAGGSWRPHGREPCTSRMGVWRILSGPHRIRTMRLGGIIWQQYGGGVAAGSHRRWECHRRADAITGPPETVDNGEMQVRAEPDSMRSSPPVIKSISSPVSAWLPTLALLLIWNCNFR